MSTTKKRIRKKFNLPEDTGPKTSGNPATRVAGASGTLEVRGPAGMGEDELEYRTLLQEAILWASKIVLEEQRADILRRAEARVVTLMELRG